MTTPRAIWLFVSLGLYLVGPQMGWAQGCRAEYYFDYAVYFSGSSDGTNIYTSVLTDGSASGSPSIACNYPSATHTASSYNMVGSTGGWLSEIPQAMGSYLSIQNNQQVPALDGQDYVFEYQGQVVCSVFGTIYLSIFNGKVGASAGNFINSGPGGIYAPNGCLFKLSCPSGTSSKCAPSSVSEQEAYCGYPYDHEYYLTWTPTNQPTECFHPNLGSVSNYEINCY